MKKALLIVACVAGYSLLEAGLLLSITVASPLDRFPTLHQQVVCLGQLVLLPGLAALLSRILYGPFQSLRRTLVIFLVVPLGIVVIPIAFFLLALAIALLFWADGVSRILFFALLPVVVSAVLGVFVVLVHYSGRWSVKAEAARWLEERQSGTSSRNRAWRTRGIRFAVCLPVLVTLPIFLFLPETWGLVSHVRWPHSGALAVYKVEVPITWYILYHQGQQADGRSYVNGLVGRGIGLGVDPFRYDSFAWWTVESTPNEGTWETDYDRWPPKPKNIRRRTIMSSSGAIECVDFWPSYSWKPTPDPAFAYVDCSRPGRLHASFSGSRRNLDQFYGMLSTITPTK